MKKKLCLMLAVMLLLLSACGGKKAPETTAQEPSTAATESTPVETAAEPTQLETTVPDRNGAARSAFQRALRTVHDDLRWPELPDSGNIEVWEPGTIEDEQFAVTDVDGDGEEELLVSVSNTYTVGMCEIIYGYDPQTDGVRIESHSYVGVTHYPGMLKVEASHNQGYAGDVLWPYAIAYYDEAEDSYKDAFYVDAWCKDITDYDSYTETPYPDDIDTGHDGYVYLITENGERRFMNRADYEKWEAGIFTNKEPLTIPWQKITAANIDALVK
jgi:hypothetical protein